MATFTTRMNLRKPDTSDTVNVETDINDSMDIIDLHTGFERRGDFPSSPFTGKAVMRSDQSDRCYIYDGSNWEEVLVLSSLMSPQSAGNATEVTTTSTSYVNLNPAVSITFTAPASGAIYVTITAALEAVTPSSSLATYEVRETNASGSIVTPANDVNGVAVQDDSFVRCSNRTVVSGLTPGGTYFIRVVCRTSANTSVFFHRALLIEPVLKV